MNRIVHLFRLPSREAFEESEFPPCLEIQFLIDAEIQVRKYPMLCINVDTEARCLEEFRELPDANKGKDPFKIHAIGAVQDTV